MRMIFTSFALALFAAPAFGADHAAMHGGHDHAAMLAMMAKPAAWTAYPMLKPRTSGESRERAVMTVAPQNIAPASIEAWSNNLNDANGHRQLELGMAGAKLDKPANGGYHWLAAREEQGDKVLSAATVYFYGERGGQDPTAMFMQQKQELEIIPQPFPREHSRYRAGEDWRFLLRFNGAPLAGQEVVLQTQNGTRTGLVSDAAGVVTVLIPDDFKDEPEQAGEGGHRHGPPGAEFVLATERTGGGKRYISAFNSSYGRNAYDQRSLALGIGFTLLGMVAAVPLLRQRNTAKDQESANV